MTPLTPITATPAPASGRRHTADTRSGAGSHAPRPRHAERGTALIEFVLVLPVLLILVFGVMDFGHLVEQRMILTNVAREGGSLGSREDPFDGNLLNVLVASGKPLDLGGPYGKIVVTKIKAGTSIASPVPVIAQQISTGSLGRTSNISDKFVNFGLTTNLYQHLVFNGANNAADISQVTVVEVFFNYRPITPLSYLLGGLLTKDAGGLNLSSRAIY